MLSLTRTAIPSFARVGVLRHWRIARKLLPLDANYGCRKIKTDDKNSVKTASATQYNLWKYLRIISGLKITPPMFQQAMDIILIFVKWKRVTVSIDDVIICRKLREDTRCTLGKSINSWETLDWFSNRRFVSFIVWAWTTSDRWSFGAAYNWHRKPEK